MQDIATKVEGSQLTAEEFNQIPSELENVITSTGQSLSASDLRQLAKAIAIYAGLGDFYNTSGTANNITLNPVGSLQAPSAYTKGLQIRFIPTANNTAAVNINIAGLSSVKLLDDAGNTLTAGRLITNAVYSATFNGTDFVISGVVDASLVHKAGNETISGIKNFEKIDTGDKPQIIISKNGVDNCIGILNTGSRFYIVPCNKDGVLASARPLSIDLDGSVVTTVTPPAGDSSTKIATTAWVKENAAVTITYVE